MIVSLFPPDPWLRGATRISAPQSTLWCSYIDSIRWARMFWMDWCLVWSCTGAPGHFQDISRAKVSPGDGLNNCNRDTTASSLTTATAVFFSTTAHSLRNFKKEKVYFTYVEVRIVIISSHLTIFNCNRIKWNLWFNFNSQVCCTWIFFNTYIFFYFLQFSVELKFHLISAMATAVVNFSTTALQPQPQFWKTPQPKQEPQPRFSENSQPIHH